MRATVWYLHELAHVHFSVLVEVDLVEHVGQRLLVHDHVRVLATQRVERKQDRKIQHVLVQCMYTYLWRHRELNKNSFVEI